MLERGVATIMDVNNRGLFPREVHTKLCHTVSFVGVRRANALALALELRLDLHVKH